MEQSLVYGTWALVAGTLALVGVTWWMMQKQIDLLREQTADNRANLRLQNHLTFAARFDSREFHADRKLVAEKLLAGASHDEISESVLDFFEDLGMYLRRGYFDEELAWSTFGFYAVRWWAACRDYVLEERKANNDQTLFTDFESVVERFRQLDRQHALTEPTEAEVEKFLQDEANLEIPSL